MCINTENIQRFLVQKPGCGVGTQNSKVLGI